MGSVVGVREEIRLKTQSRQRSLIRNIRLPCQIFWVFCREHDANIGFHLGKNKMIEVQFFCVQRRFHEVGVYVGFGVDGIDFLKRPVDSVRHWL